MINNDLQVVFIFLAKIMHGAIYEAFSHELSLSQNM